MMRKEMFLSKIVRPRIRNVYPREKFFSILDKCREKPVVWLSAPPGAGKTTLISSYIESNRSRCLWYQLDSNDRDLATFFHYLGIAASKASPDTSEPLPHLTPEYQFGIQAFARDYFTRLYERLGRESLIVLDNYQELPEESALHEVIGKALADMPEGMNVIIISRAAPPSVLSRMRPCQQMEVITWDELRLTTDEVKGIAAAMGTEIESDEEARKLLLRTDGWVTGLVLMHQSPGQMDLFAGPMSDYNSEEVFNYFAEEFFHKFDHGTRDFLLKSAVLPTMTVDMAKGLTGNARSAQIISLLTRKNYFVQSHAGDMLRYQYHPLFREFLLAGLKKELGPEELSDIEQRAAHLLAENGHVDDAVRLFNNNEDWDSLAALICEEAPQMLTQGRHQTVDGWLSRLPGGVMEQRPWLLYWKGCCALPFDQGSSRESFEKAFEAFLSGKDPYGIYLSWCGVVESTVHEFDDLKVLDRWIDALQDLLAALRFPSKEVESRVSLCMFMALSFRAPHHPQMKLWADRTFALIDKMPDPNMAAQISLYLVDYSIWAGDMERADVIVKRLSRGDCDHYTPLARISIKLMEALNSWYHGDLDSCISAVTEGLETAGTKGVNVFNYFLFGHGAIGALTCGELTDAKEYLKRAASVLDDRKRLCASYYHHITACHRLIVKDLSGALEHEKLSLALAEKTGSPFGEAMSRTGMAFLDFELGDRSRAEDGIKDAHELATRTGSRLIEFICYIFEAYFNLASGHRRTAVEKLKKALALGSRKGFVNFHMWRPDIMTRLCVVALEEGIEEEYVKGLIRKRGLFPEEPPLEVENWPWRLRINVLGRFSVIRDAQPLEFSKKVPKKPIDMLKLIISLGGKDIPETKISDTLWSDADGDAAHVAFTTTLKRLRGLLGIDDAIVLRNGCVTLNPRYCRVDVFALEGLIKRAEVLSEEGSEDEAAVCLKRAVEVYGDGFNMSEDEDQWAVLFHERVKSRFIRCVAMLGSHCQENGEVEKAIEYYKRGIENEPLSEELYQNLMVCLKTRGHKAEALALYQRLTKVFTRVLGIEPSTKTKNIYTSIND